LVVELRQRLEQIARMGSPLLVVGAKGCGSELCARSLRKADAPWLMLDQLEKLADVPMDLLEQVRGGTLFIAEIADLSRIEQKGLLLLVQKAEKYAVRVVCATARGLPQLVAEGCFDEALLQAIGGVTVRIPALNEHREDIPDLARTLLAHASEGGAGYREFDTAALNSLRNADWPGGLDQLKNVVKRLAAASLGDIIGLADVARVLQEFDGLEPASVAASPFSFDKPLREARDEFERLYFTHHIAKTGGNMSRVAEAVGLERTHLYRKLKQLGIGK
jgi:two-component system, NtrC family, nitrogen regulation response regulator NtrX